MPEVQRGGSHQGGTKDSAAESSPFVQAVGRNPLGARASNSGWPPPRRPRWAMSKGRVQNERRCNNEKERGILRPCLRALLGPARAEGSPRAQRTAAPQGRSRRRKDPAGAHRGCAWRGHMRVDIAATLWYMARAQAGVPASRAGRTCVEHKRPRGPARRQTKAGVLPGPTRGVVLRM